MTFSTPTSPGPMAEELSVRWWADRRAPRSTPGAPAGKAGACVGHETPEPVPGYSPFKYPIGPTLFSPRRQPVPHAQS